MAVAGLAAAPLRFQQEIIDHLVEDRSVRTLVWLCAGFLAVIALIGALKLALNFTVAGLGERVVRLIRDRLYTSSVDNGPEARVARGTLVTMVSAEAEGVGAFAGSAIATPLMQLGTLVSVIGFIAARQPQLGLIAMAVVVPQVVIVVIVQTRINRAVRRRTLYLRDAYNRLSASELKQIEDEVIADFDAILATRLRILALKRSTKFLQNLISATGTAGILLLGGWLVIQGQTDTGTVVARLTGITRIEGPWRELVAFYRQASTMRVNSELLVDAAIRTAPAAQAARA